MSNKQSRFFKIFGLPLARVLGTLLMTIFGPVRWRNRRRVPKRGGLLILSNHLADVDPILVQIACPRTVYFMAKSELFEMPFLGASLKAFKAFPVKRGEPDRQAIKHAIELLKSGEAVGVFPEGQLSESGSLQPLKPGVGLIVRMAEVPVICVALRNTNRVMPYGKFTPRFALAWVSANWGEARTFDKGTDVAAIMAWAEAEFRRLGAS